MEFRRTKSHLLRHCVEVHPELVPEKVDFRMKILTTHKSAFERQIREAVLLDYFAGPQILNSKMEYTRCGIPKLELEIGNNEKKKNPEIVKEKATIEKIKMLYKGEKKRPKNSEIDPKTMKLKGPKNQKRRNGILMYVTQKMSHNTASGIPSILAQIGLKWGKKGILMYVTHRMSHNTASGIPRILAQIVLK